MGIKYFIREAWEWIKTLILAVGLALLINMFIQPTIVKGGSMHPTLENKDLVITLKTAYLNSVPEQGDIVIFKSSFEDKIYIKRVIGKPGDRVEVKNGHVYVNNRELQEEYASTNYTEGNIDIIVPENKVFVLGDNRWPNASLDSRSSLLGLVPMENIIGKTVYRIYPVQKFGDI
jgi:signal peptidase I